MKVVDILQRVVESVNVARGCERESESVRMRETKMKEIKGKEHESNHVLSADAHVCDIGTVPLKLYERRHEYSYIHVTHTYTIHSIRHSDKTKLYTRDSLVSS